MKAAGYGHDRVSAFSNALTTALIARHLESKNQLFVKTPENGGVISELHFQFD